MTLPHLAALVPRDIQVEIRDELPEDIRFSEKCDLVACHSCHGRPRGPTSSPRGSGRAGKGATASLEPLRAIHTPDFITPSAWSQRPPLQLHIPAVLHSERDIVFSCTGIGREVLRARTSPAFLVCGAFVLSRGRG